MFDDLDNQHEFESQKALAAQIYTPEIIASLATKFAIQDPAHVASLREVLQFAAWLYRDLKDDAKNKPSPRTLRNKFQNILSLTETLKSGLSSLNKTAGE